MEHMPDRLKLVEIWNGKSVNVVPEGEEEDVQIFDSLLPFGRPPLTKTTEAQLEDILDDIDDLPLYKIDRLQRHFPSESSAYSLFSLDTCPAQTDLKIIRDLATGELEGFEEVVDEETVHLLNEDQKINFDDVSEFLTTPPGFEQGLIFPAAKQVLVSEVQQKPGETARVLKLADLMLDHGTPVSTVPSAAGDKSPMRKADKIQGEDFLNVDDSDLMKQLPSEPVTSVLKISNFIQQPKMKLEWAELVDISKPVTDFQKKVPDMAYTWPFELDTFQKQAIVHLESRNSVFVAAHTSAGKTVVAEYAIALSRRHMTKTIYTSPIKALSNQKFRDFKETFKEIGLITGDIQINKEAPCLIMTTEILRSMLYNKSDIVNDLEYVIFDECHYINDPERGVVWEEVLIMLPKHVGLVLLSATVPNALELANWIGRIKGRKLYVISTTKRPIPLEHYLYLGQVKDFEKALILDANNNFLTVGYQNAVVNFKKVRTGAKGAKITTNFQDEKNRYIGLINYLRKNDQLPTIIFTFSRKRCDENASLLKSMDLTTAEEKSTIHKFVQSCISRLNHSDQKLPQIRIMKLLLESGFGVHHSGILPILKEVVEMLFHRGLIKVLFATETFAMGVNMPARTVVFDSIQKHDGHQRRDLLPAEYIQMAGRAGRRGKDTTGTVLIMCKGNIPESSSLALMMLGKPTELQSKFRVTYSMILNLKAEAQKRVEDMIKDSFHENFKQKNNTALKVKKQQLEDTLSKMPSLDCDICSKDVENGLKHLALYEDMRKDVWDLIFSQPYSSKIFSAGRLIILKYPSLGNVAGVILSATSLKDKKLSVLVVKESKDPTDASRKKDNDDFKTVPWPLSKRLFTPEGPSLNETVAVTCENLLSVCASVIKIDQGKGMQSKNAAAQELLQVIEGNSKGLCSINLVKDLRISSFDVIDSIKKYQALEEKLSTLDCLKCPLFSEHYVTACQRQSVTDELLKAQFLLSEQSLAMMPDYQKHIQVLETLKYVVPNGPLTLKGRVARTMSNFEMMITELLLEDTLVSLGAAEIAALLSCTVFQQKLDDDPEIPPTLEQPVHQFYRIAERIGTVQRDCGFLEPPEDFINQFNFGLTKVVYHWAKGMPFSQIMEMTDIQEGIIVRCIQRLDEVLKDVKDAARVIGNQELYKKMEEASVLIRRDIVFAASLYLV